MVMKANKTKGNKTIRDLRFDNEKNIKGTQLAHLRTNLAVCFKSNFCTTKIEIGLLQN